MRPPDKVKRDIVKQWLLKAEEDLGVAEILIAQKSRFLSAVGFHAQQAAEKYLKALLTYRQIDFLKTHDLGLLLDLFAKTDPSLIDSLNRISILNPFGVDNRYPGDIPQVSYRDARDAIELVKTVREAIMLILPDDRVMD